MTDHQEAPTGAEERIEDEAIGWFVRMRGDTDQSLRERFDAWYAVSAEHRRAYHWAEAHFAASATLKQSRQVRTGWHPGPSTWLMAGAAAAAVLLLAFATQASRPIPGNPVIASTGETVKPLMTAAREIRTWRLSDGSTVTLDADSRVDVAMTTVSRRLQVRKGKARFAVVRDPRPFLVEAASGAVAADQAVLDVGFDRGGRVMVNLLLGRANVRSLVQPAVFMVPGRTLRPGRSLFYPAATFAPTEVAGYAADTRDWPQGWVEYRAILLRDLVAQANRYAASPIVIRDPAVGALSASGRFRLTDTDAFVSRIAEALDLSAKRRADGIYLDRQ